MQKMPISSHKSTSALAAAAQHGRSSNQSASIKKNGRHPTVSSIKSPMESLTKTKILVVHNSALMRFALVQVIEQNRRFEICAETDAVPTARKLFVQYQPQIILLGLTLRGGDGIELIKDFRKLDPASCAVVLSRREDALSMQRAFRAGARGYLLDRDEIPEILMALVEVSNGGLYASPNVARRLLESLAIGAIEQGPSELKILSDRELQIFSLIGRGFGAMRLADELHLSVKTVETHQMHIKEKLGLRSAAALSEKATRWMLGSVRRNLQLKKQALSKKEIASSKAGHLTLI